MGYLLRGFLGKGTAQLLDHMIVIEALLGGTQTRTERMAKRLGRILGKTDEETWQIKEDFERIYRARCDLVHGTLGDQSIDNQSLRRARYFARCATLWFIHCVNYAARSEIGKRVDPGQIRADILALIDQGRDNVGRLADLADTLPKSFPHLDW